MRVGPQIMKTIPTASEHFAEHKQGGLTQFPATAISGNDITSSCLYVSALAIIAAGRLAPLVLVIVAAVLYLFRPIYAEVVGALPLNGGAYNALLNTTSKYRASLAACLTILSYMATAVISANEAIKYSSLFEDGSPVILATIGLLGVFMVLTIIGISESSKVAVVIFVTHLSALTLLLAVGIWYVAWTGLGTLSQNLATPEPGGFVTALFFGFAAALLGISGFESSANFVEEQSEGTFPKTLRNMWAASAFFNPAMAILALALIDIPDVAKHTSGFLAHLGATAGGEWLRLVISVDAVLVLSGAVLTSFVGINGLVRRMTLDRCLPQFLLKKNRRGTTHRIVIAFFLLCVSVLLVSEGEVATLAGVYTLSFLSVMVLFCLGNILLKVKRDSLPRASRAAWPTVLIAMVAVSVGLAGNVLKKPDSPDEPRNIVVFLEYFIPALLIVSIMLTRISLLKISLFVVRATISAMVQPMHAVTQWIRTKIDEINSQQVVFFTRGNNLAGLNNAMLYVRQNEHTTRLKVVTVVKLSDEVPPRLKTELEFLDEAYPEIDIEFVVLEGKFGPELIHELSEQWGIPANLMFIGSPRGHLMYGLAELGGVRLII